MNVGEWAVQELELVCDPTGRGYANRGIRARQSNEAQRVDIHESI